MHKERFKVESQGSICEATERDETGQAYWAQQASVGSLNIILKAVKSHQRGVDQKRWYDPIYLKGLFACMWKICISFCKPHGTRTLWEGREQGQAGAGRMGQEGWDKEVLSFCSFSWLFRNQRAPCMEVKDMFHPAAFKDLMVGLLPLYIIFLKFSFNFQESNFELKNIHLF